MFIFTKYGDTWRRHRRLFYQEFQPSAVTGFRAHQREHAHPLLRHLIDDPAMFAQHIKHIEHHVHCVWN
ncbi:hypothetical protein B0H16DRAFT_1530362 [Mycena metata]|uniref:Cytochrome P450 n=1 Tax=Mycena metata TaxID=1033252 RepID=A0AAD7JCS4_9AGAR|nr:hypothetical protein B0H16DRAFT_1530362 [Mycena metata]